MTELRTPPADRLPDLEAEQEIDFGRYWNVLLTRWWLPLGGLVIGLVLGYLVVLGSRQVYQAKAVLYLGQPLSPGGSAQVQSVATNPTTVGQIVHSESAIREAVSEAEMRPGELSGKVSSHAVSGSIGRLGQSPLVEITVRGSRKRKVADAANALAAVVVSRLGGYAKAKIQTFRTELASDDRELAVIRAEIDALNGRQGLPDPERLVLLSLAEQRRATVEQDRLEARQLLALAEQVEQPRVVNDAVAVKKTARSTRNSAAVAGFFGLLLGIIAALLWEPVAARTGRPA